MFSILMISNIFFNWYDQIYLIAINVLVTIFSIEYFSIFKLSFFFKYNKFIATCPYSEHYE